MHGLGGKMPEKIVKPIWRFRLQKVIIRPSPNCNEVSFNYGVAEHRYFIVAVCKFKILVIMSACKWLLKRVFKK